MKFPLIFYRRKTFSIERIADVVIKALYPDKSSHIRDILDKKRIYFNTHDLSSLHQYLEVAGHIVQLDKEEAPKHGQIPSTSSFSEIPEKDRGLENFQDMMDPDAVSFYKVALTNEVVQNTGVRLRPFLNLGCYGIIANIPYINLSIKYPWLTEWSR